MAVVLDTSVVIALMVTAEPDHEVVRSWIETLDDDLVTTPLAVAEMDHLISARGGPDGARHLWDDFASGAYGVRWWADAMAQTIEIARAAPRIGLTDASLVALAHRLSTTRIATFDDRHFRTLTTAAGEPFVLLPADAT